MAAESIDKKVEISLGCGVEVILDSIEKNKELSKKYKINYIGFPFYGACIEGEGFCVRGLYLKEAKAIIYNKEGKENFTYFFNNVLRKD